MNLRRTTCTQLAAPTGASTSEREKNMQARYSGFFYIGSETRRAAKPVIESLTPILPTFGYGKAVVKKV